MTVMTEILEHFNEEDITKKKSYYNILEKQSRKKNREVIVEKTIEVTEDSVMMATPKLLKPVR